jgi:hypothetical protein
VKSILRSLFIVLLFTSLVAAQTKQAAWHTFATQNATGATPGFDVSFTAAYWHSISLTVTGAPSACTYKLQGSVDGTIWMDLSPAVACTSSTAFQAGPAAVNQVRGNLVSLSGGDFSHGGGDVCGRERRCYEYSRCPRAAVCVSPEQRKQCASMGLVRLSSMATTGCRSEQSHDQQSLDHGSRGRQLFKRL